MNRAEAKAVRELIAAAERAITTLDRHWYNLANATKPEVKARATVKWKAAELDFQAKVRQVREDLAAEEAERRISRQVSFKLDGAMTPRTPRNGADHDAEPPLSVRNDPPE